MWTLRGYVVERLLGAGGTGEVWRARVAATDEAVALKRMALPDGARARREAAILSALDHPHLVRLHALVPGEDVSVLVLDLAEGGSLADLLAARGRLTPGEVITAVSPIAAALAYLHAAGVVHGDVSPANILFTPGGIPLLADLGVARLTGDEADAESTPAYVDPAVADGCIPGPTSDVFMLGAVALHALTGSSAWPGTSDQALVAARAERLGDVAGRLDAAGVPADMARVVGRALELDASRRCTAAGFALELRHSGEPLAVQLGAGRPRRDAPSDVVVPGVWTGPRHAAATPAAPPTRSLKPRPRPTLPAPRARGLRAVLPGSRRAVVGAIAVCIAILALLGVAGFALRGDGAAPPPSPVAAARSATPRLPSTTRTSVPAALTWTDRLAALDAVRSRAFATRRPELLRQVYVPGPLLLADTRLLLRLVPVGCGLLGVRTAYRTVQAVPRGSVVDLTVVASLPASRLTCRGRESAHAAASGPTQLRVRLQRTGTAWLIASTVLV